MVFSTPTQNLRVRILTILVDLFLLKVFKNLSPYLLTNFINYFQGYKHTPIRLFKTSVIYFEAIYNIVYKIYESKAPEGVLRHFYDLL